MNKLILEVVHETALGLAGAMKQNTLGEIESLCLPPVNSKKIPREPNQVDFEIQVF